MKTKFKTTLKTIATIGTFALLAGTTTITANINPSSVGITQSPYSENTWCVNRGIEAQIIAKEIRLFSRTKKFDLASERTLELVWLLNMIQKGCDVELPKGTLDIYMGLADRFRQADTEMKGN